jgi:elongation factor G
MHNIRNIAFTGQANGGKTTLLERILFETNATTNLGEVTAGNTVSDYSEQAKELGHSVESTFVHCLDEAHRLHLLDTPGFPDFTGRAISVFPAVESVIVVIDANEGIDNITETMMDVAKKRQKCRMIVINKIDMNKETLGELVTSIQEKFGKECLPINLPSADGERVVDCFFDPEYEASTSCFDVTNSHDALIDQVVEVDEALMAQYLEQGEILDPEQLHAPFEAALRDQHLIPICFTSAKTGAGVELLIRILSELMPEPAEGNPPLFLNHDKPVSVTPDASLHLVAHVFKVSLDPFLGRLAYVRVHQGTLKPDTQFFVGDNKKTTKAGHLFLPFGKERQEISQALPGDICIIAKVDDLHFDDVLHDSHDEDHFHLKSIDFPSPMYGLALQPKKRGDEQKLSDTLRKIVDEDPSLSVSHRATLNETVLEGVGEIHLKVALDKMASQFHLDVEIQQPSVDYRETIITAATSQYRHKKQSGGSGQFGEVHITVEPLARGEGFEFVNKIVGGVIPGQYIPGVEKGIRQAMDEGVIAGYKMQDIKVTLFDGKHHAVDSKEIAFVVAGRKAFQQAIREAKPVILEPVVEVTVNCESDLMGDITADLASHRGMIVDTQPQLKGKARITAKVPQSEMHDYVARIKSITSGTGTFKVAFSHYDPVPATIQQAMKKQLVEQED